MGGGFAGLAAARELKRRGRSPLLLERASEPGGRVRTEQWASSRIELGAHVVTPAYSRTLELVDELGLRDELVPVENAFRAAVRRDSRWHYVDYAQPLTQLRFSGIGARDKLSLLRGATPAIISARKLRYGDIATAARLDSRSASEAFRPDAFDFYVHPIYEAFFGYRPADVSYAVMALAMLSRGRPLTFAAGMGALSSHLAAEIEVKTGVVVREVREEGEHVCVIAGTSDGRPFDLRARAVILATPADETARLWPAAPGPARELLQSVAYSRADRVYLRTREPFRPQARDGKPIHMELIPAAEREGRLLALLEFMHQRADGGGLLYAEAAPGSGAERLDDATLVERLQGEVETLHPELRGEIRAHRVVRTAPMTPLFPAGQSRRLATFRGAVAPGTIELAGDYLNAPWIEGAVVSGEAAAARVDAVLQSRD